MQSGYMKEMALIVDMYILFFGQFIMYLFSNCFSNMMFFSLKRILQATFPSLLCEGRLR
jgi:hypothetical protein